MCEFNRMFCLHSRLEYMPGVPPVGPFSEKKKESFRHEVKQNWREHWHNKTPIGRIFTPYMGGTPMPGYWPTVVYSAIVNGEQRQYTRWACQSTQGEFFCGCEVLDFNNRLLKIRRDFDGLDLVPFNFYEFFDFWVIRNAPSYKTMQLPAPVPEMWSFAKGVTKAQENEMQTWEERMYEDL